MPLQNKNVLLVEDEFLVALWMEELITDLGAASVHMAPTAAAASEILDRGLPDFAMLDVNLGDGNSYPTARRLDEMAVPFIFLTGYGRAGVDDAWQGRTILQKPVSPEALRAGVRQALGSGGVEKPEYR